MSILLHHGPTVPRSTAGAPSFADFIYRTHIIKRYGQKFLHACGPELTIQDWGVTYDELEPHYDRPLSPSSPWLGQAFLLIPAPATGEIHRD